MALATRRRPNTSAPGDGSRTITVLDSQPRDVDSDSSGDHTAGTLYLRGGPREPRQHISWDESVVDNEACGKKKSKICCIYHKPKRFDESSDESSSSDSDSSYDDGRARPVNRRRRPPRHSHPDGSPHGEGLRHADNSASTSSVHEPCESEDEVNDYERTQGGKKGKRRS